MRIALALVVLLLGGCGDPPTAADFCHQSPPLYAECDTPPGARP